MRSDPENRNRLSWWFPKIFHIKGINKPSTEIISYVGKNLLCVLDGERPPIAFHDLCYKISQAGSRMGWPLFLRTDYLSGKHSWRNSCFVSGPVEVALHIIRLVEESELADMMGFPTDYWIARKMIPTTAAFSAFHGKMPIVKERRYFVHDDQVVCHHPYWPPQVFDNVYVSVKEWRLRLSAMNIERSEEVDMLSKLSSKVGRAIGGDWSIDWLWSEQEGKWYLTDMAEAACSYHWPGCPQEWCFK